MTRVFLDIPKVSQMDDPLHGTGSGGDRCSEACAAMIDYAYKLGPSAQAGGDPQATMLDLTAYLNAGSTVSVPEDFSVWFPKWLADKGYSQVSISHLGSQTFADCQAVVNRQHMAVLFVRDYTQLTVWDGSDPYTWKPTDHAGHYVALAGYDDSYQGVQTLIVHDPLRGTSGQPWDYAWSSFVAAGLADIMEVEGAPLSVVGAVPAPVPVPVPAPPPPAPDPLKALQDSLAAVSAQLAVANQQLADYQAKLAQDTAALTDEQNKLQSVKAWLAAVPAL